MSGRPLRIMIVDDSAIVRAALTELISGEPDLEVLATATDPFDAAEQLRQALPDVIVLDIEMPKMDGISFLRRMMAQRPIPVIICSTLIADGSRAMMDAFDAGAVEVIGKPKLGTREFFEEARIEVCDKIRAAARARLDRRSQNGARRTDKGLLARTREPTTGRPPSPHRGARPRLVAIGASTGGTEALRDIISALPANAPPVMIVQHMPEGFTTAFAARLDSVSRVRVTEARDGDVLSPGRAYLAPGNQHLRLRRQGAQLVCGLSQEELISRHRPSVNALFDSVAEIAGRGALGVILTGMGSDGASGLLKMRESGAHTVGQDEASCVVYGMPREAKRVGAVEQEMPLGQIATYLSQTLA